MPATTFRPPSFQLSNRATTLRTKKQNSPPIRRSHLPQFSSQTLIIRIRYSPTFPRQLINVISSSGFKTIFSLQLQIKLNRFLETFTARLVTLSRSGSTAELKEKDGENEKREEAKNVRGRREVKGKRGVREEERKGVKDVREVRG